MVKYVIRRLIQAVPIFFGITVLSYMLMALTPGGPLGALVFGNPRLTERQKEAIAAQLGVNDSVPIQYLRWLLGDDWMRWDSDGDGLADGSFLIALDANGDGEPEPPGNRRGILRGDFGESFASRRPVLDVLGAHVGATLELAVSSLIIGVTVGIAIGIIAAVNRGGLFDNITRVMAVIFNAVPGFWLALLLLLLFSVELGWLPLGDRCETTLDDSCPPIQERLEYMVLPVFVLATGPIAGFSRFMRASMLEVISQDYIRTARAKGLSNRVVWVRHGMKNAMIPIATFLGPALTGLLGGAVVTETVFNYHGLGRVTVQAFTGRDYPIVMAVTIYAALATIIGYLISDILYALIDPRIRY